MWEWSGYILEYGGSDTYLELSPGKSDSGEVANLSGGTPVFHEHQYLARALFAIRMTKTRPCEVWWSVNDFLFGFPAVAASGYHFAHHFLMESLQFLFAKVT
jgi:hypothetical protein